VREDGNLWDEVVDHRSPVVWPLESEPSPTRRVLSVTKLGLGAVRCQPAKMARAWCIARVVIGTSEKGGWQRVAGPKRLPGYVGRSVG